MNIYLEGLNPIKITYFFFNFTMLRYCVCYIHHSIFIISKPSSLLQKSPFFCNIIFWILWGCPNTNLHDGALKQFFTTTKKHFVQRCSRKNFDRSLKASLNSYQIICQKKSRNGGIGFARILYFSKTIFYQNVYKFQFHQHFTSAFLFRKRVSLNIWQTSNI